MKVALISHMLPPSSSGQAMMIYRLFRDVSPESYCLISPERHEPNALGSNSFSLPGKYYQLPPPTRLTRGYRFGLRYLREGINIPMVVAQQANRVTDIVRRERCDAIVACTGELTHMPAGYLASRRAGIPFFSYVFDHYSYREWMDPAAAFWARRLEPFLMKRANAVITPNETLRDDLRERFGIEAPVIHNSVDISPYETNGRPSQDEHGSEIKIVYTGDVYEAHYDAFKSLMLAIELLGRPEIKVHIYTDRPLEHFAKYGIKGPLVRHPHQSHDEIPSIQMGADLLFLPLAFNSPYPDLVRTSATTKLGEYLAARRPTIVHAPPDSFIVTYFRQHDCGVVVDRVDPSLLAREIDRVLDDAALRERLAARAWERARRDFDIAVARATFWDLVKRTTAARA